MAVDHCYHFGSQLQLDIYWLCFTLSLLANRRKNLVCFRVPLINNMQTSYRHQIRNPNPYGADDGSEQKVNRICTNVVLQLQSKFNHY